MGGTRALIAALVVFAAASAAAAEGRTILVVESYHPGFAWDASYREGLAEVLGRDWRLEYFAMDTKRLPPSEHPRMAEAARRRCRELKPALVILGDDAAFKALAPRLAAERVPVVFLGVNANPRAYFTILPPTMTGVLERPIFKRSIAYLAELFPQARSGFVLFDTDLTSHLIKAEVFDGQDRQTIRGMDIDLRLVGDRATWKKTVREARGAYDFIVVGLYQTVRDGRTVFDPEQLMRWTARESPVPVLGFWDFAVGPDKAVGGLVLYGKDIGLLAGRMAASILGGTPPSDIPYVSDTQGVFLFSRTQLERWKLVLPPSILKSARFTD